MSFLIDLGDKLTTSLLDRVKSHLLALYAKCDPMQQIDPASQPVLDVKFQGFDPQFLFPLLLLIISALYGTFGLHYQASGNFNVLQLASSPHIFTHQIVPRSIWTLIDFGFTLDLVAVFFIFCHLTFGRRIKPEWIVSIDCNRNIRLGAKCLKKKEAAQVLRFRQMAKLVALLTSWLVSTLFTVYFLYGALWVNYQGEEMSWATIVYWATFPLFVFYICYGKVTKGVLEFLKTQTNISSLRPSSVLDSRQQVHPNSTADFTERLYAAESENGSRLQPETTQVSTKTPSLCNCPKHSILD